MEARQAYFEAHLVMAQSEADFYEKELRHVQKTVITLNTRIDQLLDMISDLEHQLDKSRAAEKHWKEIVEKHISTL